MEIINRNILDIEYGIIVHQVNCMGVMGAGLALSIKQRYPEVYKIYNKNYFMKELGDIQMVKIRPDFYVCNLFGQYDYGKEQKCYTDYKAVRNGLRKLYKKSINLTLPIFIPYRMGCGLAGGDWDKYLEIIKNECIAATICRKEGD